MPHYSEDFFARQKVDSYQSAQVVVLELLKSLKISSVVDIGCGLGAWLKVFEENGISDYQGLDGDWVDQSNLLIPRAKFVVQELENDFDLTRKFDLAVCLELAEHLSATRADSLIKFLTKLSPVVLFSAAIPGQDLPGKMNHINEQWPEYWATKFTANNFLAIDYLRDKIWLNDQVKYWYQQNILLYMSSEFLDKNKQWQKFLVEPKKIVRIHPTTYRTTLKYYQTK